MSVNKQRTPSEILSSILPSHLAREYYAPKTNEAVESSSKNIAMNRPYELQRSKDQAQPTIDTRLISWVSQHNESPKRDFKDRYTTNRNKGSPLASRTPTRTEMTTGALSTIRQIAPGGYEEPVSKKMNTSGIYASREIESNTREGASSYAKLWREGKELRDISMSMNRARPVNVDQESIIANSYFRQHLSKKLKKTSAANIIQKWFRERRKKSPRKGSPSNQVVKQEWVGTRSVRSTVAQKLENKKARQALQKNAQKKGNSSGYYEYEELEGGKGDEIAQQNGEDSMQTKVLEEMYKQMQENILEKTRSLTSERRSQDRKEDSQSFERKSFSSKDAQKSLEYYSSLEQSQNGLSRMPTEKMMQSVKSSPPKYIVQASLKGNERGSWERSLRGKLFSYKDYEKAAVKIQRVVRKYFRGRYRTNRSIKVAELVNRNSSESFRSRRQNEGLEDQSFPSLKGKKPSEGKLNTIVEQLSQELRAANQNMFKLQKENERLQKEMSEAKSQMEKKIEERLFVEKEKVKEVLNEYNQFIDKLLQEKMKVAEHYDVMEKDNKELKIQLNKYKETEAKQREWEQKVAGVEAEKKIMQENFNKVSNELKVLQEERKNLCPLEIVNGLKLENGNLKGRIAELEARLAQAVQSITNYNEVCEINQILSQKLQYAGAHITNIEAKLQESEMKYMALEKEYVEKVQIILKNQEQEPHSQKILNKRVDCPPITEDQEEDFNSQTEQQEVDVADCKMIAPVEKDVSKQEDEEEEELECVVQKFNQTIKSINESFVKKQEVIQKGRVLHQEEIFIEENDLERGNNSEEKAELNEADHLKSPRVAEFSFEVKGTGVINTSNLMESFKVDSDYGEMSARDQNRNQILFSVDTHRTKLEERNNREGEHEVGQEQDDNRVQMHPFELKDSSKEYVSGKFAQAEESSIQENTLDDEQNREINLLIQNISRKLELAKTKMEDRPITREYEEEIEEFMPNTDNKITKTLSTQDLGLHEDHSMSQENKRGIKSSINLHEGSIVLIEEQEASPQQVSNQKKKDEQKGTGNVKKGILDTLKKAELLFGRGNS